MSDKQKAIADLKLGDTVYEPDPWTGRVLTRHVSSVVVTTEWSAAFHRVADGFPKTRLKISGGMLGAGNEAKADDWGKRYFTSLTEARRVCAERAVELQAARRAQIQKEIRELQTQLEKDSE